MRTSDSQTPEVPSAPRACKRPRAALVLTRTSGILHFYCLRLCCNFSSSVLHMHASGCALRLCSCVPQAFLVCISSANFICCSRDMAARHTCAHVRLRYVTWVDSHTPKVLDSRTPNVPSPPRACKRLRAALALMRTSDDLALYFKHSFFPPPWKTWLCASLALVCVHTGASGILHFNCFNLYCVCRPHSLVRMRAAARCACAHAHLLIPILHLHSSFSLFI